MDLFRSLLLEVWREACRHIEIEESVGTIAGLVARRMPIDHVSVVAIDQEGGRIERRAAGLDASGVVFRARALGPQERRLLGSWVKRGAVVHPGMDGVGGGVLRLLLGGEADVERWCAGPLLTEHDTAGAVLLRAGPAARFEPDQLRVVESLLEPLSVALENDRRLRELNVLREAAEADKRSALSRLGRDDLVDTIVGADGGLAGVMERVRLVAPADIPVLILGETGSGKELVARAIHEQSHRGSQPFVRVNCGALPPELIDSELFGHERGAFTGASSSRRGRFERANRGTLLLDEIGEMPLAAQVRLLRVLQDGAFERVGGERPMQVNVRVVAATHRDLPAMVQDGRFREDLWYRVSVFTIVLPPLRERKQDLPDLIDHLARRAAKRFGLRPQSATPADLAVAAVYDWPGNIRELASVIDRAAILGDGARLDVARALGAEGGAPRPALPDERIASATAPAGVNTLDEAMRRHIETALLVTRGRIEGDHGAARLLGINPHTLRARMRKLGIDWTRYR